MKLFLILLLSVVFSSCSGDSNTEPQEPPVTTPPVTQIDPTEGYSSGNQILENSDSRLPEEQEWAIVSELTDEFEGESLDETKWDDYHPHWAGRAPSKFKKGNAFVENGRLNLRSTLLKDPSEVEDPDTDIWVNSAAMVSKDWSAKPGYYYEASMKASSLSMTSSFWFRVGEYSEIDVIEHIGNASNPVSETRDKNLGYQYHTNAFHYFGSEVIDVVRNEWTMPTLGREEFHVYGLWWKDANTLHFYHNGKLVMTTTPPTSFEENLKMIFDTEVFSFYTASWGLPGLPLVENLNDDSKNTAYIDFVRTYKKSEVSYNSGLLTNGSFESNGLNGWLWKGDVKINNNTLNLNEGVIYLELKDQGSVIQEIDVEKNTEYRLSWSSKIENEELQVEVYDIKNAANNNTSWQEDEFSFNTGDTDKVYISFTAATGATAFIDAIKLEKL
ncbi:carbohydrate binding domain-containing protein [Christiangramia forsetii]|uniref:Membrane or secreted glycosyl hydrolase, family 16 n=2 Tax=Christiangramia forsetii TaxID=411153 RepID=A0M240_CHRFK|nr:carbohydrate binding domain-containing protein [Christiangramia forsetii]GGG40162.1 glycosyl hydrolase- kappa-carrageenase precursor [Christiangramia forsetii]CAL66685.1 membrane or secreted glycosyl hydrolase, family 16 [Christiangramia forsetii KT0803]